MEIFFALIGFAIIAYLLSKVNSLSMKQDEFISTINKLDARLKKLEWTRIIADEKEKEAAKYKPAETKSPEQAKTPEATAVPDLPFIVTEVVDEEEGVEEEEVVEEEIEENVELLVKATEVVEEKKEELVEEETVSPVVELEKKAPEVAAPVFDRYSEITKAKTYPTSNNPKPFQAKQPPVIKKENEFWAKIEKQFIENWTGILGSVIMVVGVGFLGIYAALKISALGRFILISGFAAVLGGLFFYLHKKPEWLKLALWLRSSAGAIFLFACAGSIAIPGLKWVESEALQLVILSLGVAVNLFLGYIGKNQGLASLHVLLSLVGVWIIPSSPMTLIVGGVITLFGVALTYREKWDYHLLLTISSFFAFHLLYWFSLNHVISVSDRIYGIVTVVIVGVAVALVHYREAYSKKKFERIPFIVHLVNWFYFALSLYLYSSGSKVSTFALAVGSIAAYLLSRRAKKLDIRWLFLTDTLIAQLTAMVALITLSRWEIDQSVILATIFIEVILFLFIAKKENDLLLYKIGTVSINVVGIFLLVYCMISFNLLNETLLYNHAGSLLASALAGTAFLFYSNKSNTFDLSGLFAPFNLNMNEKTKHPLLSMVVGLFFVSYYSHLYEFNWSIYSVVVLLGVILYLRHKVQSTELAFISIIFLLGSHIVNWISLYHIRDQSPSQIILVGMPILVASALSIRFSFLNATSKYLNWIGVYLFSAQLIIVSYYLLYPHSVLAVSAGWLVLSLLANILVKFISKKSSQYHQLDRYILHVGYVLIGLFLIRHLTYNLNTDEVWGPMKARIWIELSAFFVFLFWAISKNKENTEYRSWKYLHPILVELVLLFSFSSLTYELDYQYLGLTWLGVAAITFALANWKYESIGRLTLYSFAIFLMSIFQELYIYYRVHADFGSSSMFPTQEFILASVYILLSLGFLALFFKRAKLEAFNSPYLLRDLTLVGETLHKAAAFIGVYVYGVFLLLMTYFMFASFSEIIPGVIWLLLAAVIVSLSIFFYGKKSNVPHVDRYMLHLTYLFLFAFVIRHILVHIQIESYVGIFKLRFLMEILALAVFTYCATLKKPETTTYKSWDYLHPLLVELLILFSIFTIALEVDGIWQPLIWVSMSFIFALAGNSKYESLSRLSFYALIIYWVAAFQTAFVTSSYIVPSKELFAQPWVYGTLSLLFQFAFLLYFYLRCSFEKIVLPKSLEFLEELIAKVDKSRNTYVFYPLIICTAIFLFWTFDKSVLTLLWVIECLAIFMVSLILKKQHFRYVALGALAICIVRLMFFDLAQSSTLTRAIVFLSVGIIMLIMNSLYNKFKNRFE